MMQKGYVAGGGKYSNDNPSRWVVRCQVGVISLFIAMVIIVIAEGIFFGFGGGNSARQQLNYPIITLVAPNGEKLKPSYVASEINSDSHMVVFTDEKTGEKIRWKGSWTIQYPEKRH